MTNRGVAASLWLAIGFIAGLVVIAAGILLMRWFDPFHTGLNFDMSRPTVVRQIRQLQRLETVVFAMDKIVAGGYENRYLPHMLAGDRLLLVVYGDVTAGVDLGRLEPSGVKMEGRAVTLTLPAAEIFSTRLDNGKTRVYSR